jgi:hypothetical protein
MPFLLAGVRVVALEPLHIVNGDSTRMGLERSNVPGTCASWGDALHEGPTPAGVTPEEWRRVRVEYLVSRGLEDAGNVASQYERDDAALESWPGHDEVVFWFEHDLYDQLILIRHLDWLSRIPDRRGTRFSLICGPTYLSPLKPEHLDALFPTRAPIVDAQVQLGVRAWQAFCAPEPQALEQVAKSHTSALPFLAGALRRHFEDYPSVENGLSRSETQILTAIDAGASTLHDAFGACARMEERVFMGDFTFRTIANGLASGAHPLITKPDGPMHQGLPRGEIALTEVGREVMVGRADHIRLNGIDKWMGGVHLTAATCYRWQGELLIADC